MAKEKSFRAKAKAWAQKHGLHGQSAFLRYVMFVFTENVNRITEDFVFKGGNLLWLYIHTPRATVDLDFATKSLSAHQEVRAILEQVSSIAGEIEFHVADFKEIEQNGVLAAAARISYKTSDGAANTFDLDIVYAIGSEDISFPSPLGGGESIRASSLEKIIADKVTTCHRFKSGNTRMKDYDDLWRISRAGKSLNAELLRTLLPGNRALKPEWADTEMQAAWQRHRGRYPDLPADLRAAMEEINKWLNDAL